MRAFAVRSFGEAPAIYNLTRTRNVSSAAGIGRVCGSQSDRLQTPRKANRHINISFCQARGLLLVQPERY